MPNPDRTLRRTDHDIVYQIEWYVDVEGQLGYWTPLVLKQGRDWTAYKRLAERWFRRATHSPRRLVAVERRVLEEVG